ncbi:MAG: NAD-dependent epimerase/dehydratase family protein [Vicinamibacteria bacterium]
MDERTPIGRVVIAGGSGFLGQSLARRLVAHGCDVVILSRSLPARGVGRHAPWDARTLGDWAHHLDGASALVNLTGRTVDCIKTPDHCDEILRSRVESTAVLGAAVRSIKNPPSVWVQMSTAHIYGDPPEEVCDEDSAFGYGLAPIVGQAWEEAFERAVLPSMRGVVLRTSFVLGRDEGALKRLTALARWGLGGTVGHGRQGMSWIHEADMNRLFIRAMTNDSMSGAYLATAPKPISNADFMRALRRSMNVPIGLPAAEWMVRIGAPLIMRTDPELGLYGRYCVSRRLKEEGFEFSFSEVTAALGDLHGKK